VAEKGTNRPIEGAQVMLAAQDSEDLSDQGAGSMVTGVTDATGTVELKLRAGHLQFGMVSAPGFASGMISPAVEGVGMPPGMLVEGTVPKVVEAGVVNRFDLRLSRGVALVGKVLDAKKNPIGDAELKPLSFLGGSAPATRSAADGSYRLEGVSASAMGMVRVRAPGFTQRVQDMSPNLPPDATGEVAHDFTLHPSATVTGRVVDAEGKPVAGAKVVYRAPGGMAGIGSLLGDTSAITASDGTYAIYDVDQNTMGGADLFMVARAGGEPDGAPKPSTVRATAGGYVEGRSAPFQVPEGAVVEAPVVTMTRGARIVGTVVTPGGAPVPRARVEASFERADDVGKDAEFDVAAMLGNVRTVLADADGGFTVDHVPEGKATLTVFAAPHATTRRTVAVGKDGSPPRVEVRMRPALEVRGRVLDPDGRGVADARVRAEESTGDDAGDESYHEPVSTKTNPGGEFTLKGLPPGRVTLGVSASGFRHGTLAADPGGPPVEARLERPRAGAAARIAEIDAEILRLSQQFASVKDAAERKALTERLSDLMKEKRTLADPSAEGADGPEAPEAPAPMR
jgi:hypothetical protein